MIDIPRGDILITLTEEGKIIVYNACAKKVYFVPREIVIPFLENINLSEDVKRVNIITEE